MAKHRRRRGIALTISPQSYALITEAARQDTQGRSRSRLIEELVMEAYGE